MNLTQQTDYSLRVLIYLATTDKDLVSTSEISEAYRISNNHLIKVVNRLGHLGYIELLRGRHGGMRLAKVPGQINIADVVEAIEPSFYIVECFDAKGRCPIKPVCGLISPLRAAKDAFINELKKYTLEDAIKDIDYSSYFYKQRKR